jgi:hypothetical protein
MRQRENVTGMDVSISIEDSEFINTALKLIKIYSNKAELVDTYVAALAGMSILLGQITNVLSDTEIGIEKRVERAYGMAELMADTIGKIVEQKNDLTNSADMGE